MNDQATQLRDMLNRRAVVAPGPAVISVGPKNEYLRGPEQINIARSVAIVSGKGGVGKSNLAVNLAVVMSGIGRRVCLLDADLGLANADVLCNLSPHLNLNHVIDGRCRLAETMMLAPGGFRLIPGASGVGRLADLKKESRQTVLEQLSTLELVSDFILIDCAAGLDSNVLGFASAAYTTVVISTPEPTAITDSYSTIKMINRRHPQARIVIVVNMAASESEGQAVFHRMKRACESFVGVTPEFGGVIPFDRTVGLAVRQRMPFVLSEPDSPAAQAVRRIAGFLAGYKCHLSYQQQNSPPMAGFFSRLLLRLGVLETVNQIE